jgi:hypothetical protein
MGRSPELRVLAFDILELAGFNLPALFKEMNLRNS